MADLPTNVLQQLPNALSTLRLAIAAVFPLTGGLVQVALVVIGAGTDLVDGVIARRYGFTSVLGGVLDGIADKAFTLSVLGTLTFQGQFSWWQLLMLLSRDLIVIPLGVVAGYFGRWDALEHRGFGKITTGLLFILMFVASALPDERDWITGLFVIAAIVSIVAAVDYGAVFLRKLSRRDQQQA